MPPETLRTFQTTLRASLLGRPGDATEAPATAHIATTAPFTPAERLNIYRNNTILSLTEVLEGSYPAVRALVGEDFFKHAARTFVRSHPPQQGCLIFYGDGFADHLATMNELAAHPYLPDVARLEWALQESYNAAAAVPLAPDSLAAVAPQAYPELTFTLHPTVRLVTSSHPIWQIWRMATQQPDLQVDMAAGGEHVLLHRPKLDIDVTRISPAAAALLATLADSQTFGDAVAAALAIDPDFPLQTALTDWLTSGLFSQFKTTT